MTTRIHTQTEPSFEKVTQTFIHEFLSEIFIFPLICAINRDTAKMI